MKRLLYILPVVLACLPSCRKNPSVTALFSLSTEECQIQEEIAVQNLSTAVSTQIGLCKWEWADQVSYETDPASISFSQVGTYTVKLTVWAEEGAAPPDTYTRTVKAYNNNEPPEVDFDTPATAVQDASVTFTDRSTDRTGRIVSWLWNIGGIISTEQNPTVTFISWGTDVDVTLTVTDNYGASSTLTKKINVTRSSGHDLSLTWSKAYDTKGYVYWTSPAMSPDGSKIYVSSTGYHLVCFDTAGNQTGSFDIGARGANPYSYASGGTASINNQSPTPTVGADGKVYIPVQFYENPSNAPSGTTGNGGLYCIQPGCTGEAWYFPTGQKSFYRFLAAPVFGDYVAITLKENDNTYINQNFGVINRQNGTLVQALACDQGSWGGISVASDQTLIYAASRSGAGYKVARNNGTWSTSANSDAGRLTNFLNGGSYETKGYQIAISSDNKVYVCVSTGSSTQLVCACYDLSAYTGGPPRALWTTTVDAYSAQCGYGAVLDAAGNAYYMAGNKVFRLNGHDGAKAWEYALTGGCVGVAAIDSKGYLYVCDVNGNKLLKLSSASGQLVSEIALDNPKSCPTIAADGSIYVTGNKGGVPTLYKVVGTGTNKTVAPGPNWSQLGCNPQKNGCAPQQ